MGMKNIIKNFSIFVAVVLLTITFAEAKEKKKKKKEKDCIYCLKYEKMEDWPESERPAAFIWEDINYPEGMFLDTSTTPKKKQGEAGGKVYNRFVKNKGSLNKYQHLMIRDMAYFEALSCEYDQTWKSPLLKKDGAKCAISGPYFHRKWTQTPNEIRRVIPEESYPKWDAIVGEARPDISSQWLDWSHSIIGMDFGRRETDGDSRTYHFMLDDYKTEYRKVTSV